MYQNLQDLLMDLERYIEENWTGEDETVSFIENEYTGSDYTVNPE